MNATNEKSNDNGWTNYETWAVNLWLDNEEGIYRYWREQARSWKGHEHAVGGLARQLKEEVVDAAPELGASLYSDLLSAALSEVDWHEIAEHCLDDVGPDEGKRPEASEESESEESGEAPTTPERRDAEGLFGDVIFCYTRREAIEDGALVDVSETAKEAGFRIPVALTSGVWAEFVAVPEGVEAQDEAGRLWDVLWTCRHGIARSKADESVIRFELHARNDNRDGEPPLVTLKAHCGPDDDGSPCVTVMLPDED